MNLYNTLKEKLNLAFYRPRQKEGIIFRVDRDYCIIKNPSIPAYLNLSPDEYYIWGLMDGQRTVKDLILSYYEKYGSIAPGRIFKLVSLLKDKAFLSEPPIDIYLSLKQRLSSRGFKKWIDKALSIITGRKSFESKGIDPACSFLYNLFAHFFYKRAARIIFLIISIIGAFLFLSQLLSGKYEIFQYKGSYIKGALLLYLLDFFIIFIHEGAHALTCKHYGCKVNGGGFLFYFGAPCFYINTTDIWMADKKGRIATSWAGPYSGFILAGLFSIIISIVPESPLSPILFKSAFLWNITILINFLPFIELDGYYILMDWLDIPMLRARAFDFIKRGLWRRLKQRVHFSGQERLFLFFGTASLLFSILAVFLGIAFWNRRMKRIYPELWSSGWVSRIIFIALLGAILFPLIHGIGTALYKRGHEGRRFLSEWWGRVRPSLKEDISLLMGINFLEPLNYEKLREVAQRCKRSSYKPASLVIREGDLGDEFYIIRSGEAEVFRIIDGREVNLTTLRKGDYFGELALIEKAPRASGVRAITRLELLSLRKGNFDRLLAPYIPLSATINRIKDVEALKEFPILSLLSPRELNSLHAHLKREWYPAMTEIIREGDSGDQFYLINGGKVDLLKGGERVKVLGKGDSFGETALILDSPRTATVRALTPVEIYSLKREHFDEFLKESFRRAS